MNPYLSMEVGYAFDSEACEGIYDIVGKRTNTSWKNMVRFIRSGSSRKSGR